LIPVHEFSNRLSPQIKEMPMQDLVIRGATVVDGLGRIRSALALQ
jgi:hypothetical protein